MKHQNLINLLESSTQKPGEYGITTFLNPYSYLIARKNLELFSQFNNLHCDGILLCIALRLIGIKVTRRSFDMTSLAGEIFASAETTQQNIYLIGGVEGVANRVSEIIKDHYPDIKICGYRDGFFDNATHRKSIAREIALKNPNIIIASMGTPLQEQFLTDLKNENWNGLGYTSGGFFHQTAKRGITYYPKLLNKLNMRWLYRIYDEPKLWKRYALEYPKFLALFTIDAIRYLIYKQR